MAESRRKNEDSCDFPFFALAALTMLRSSAEIEAMSAPWFRGDAGSLVSGHCRLLGSGHCRLLVSGHCRPLGSRHCRPLGSGHCRLLVSRRCRLLDRGIAGSWIGAFILTASKSKINDETPLHSCSLRGRSSLFRDIAVLG